MTEDTRNKIEITGVVKWEPNVFPGKQEGQKEIVVFALEHKAPKTDRVSVFHVKLYGDQAQQAQESNLAQGDHVFVTGRLNESKWKDKKTDEWKSRVEIWGSSLVIGDAPDDDDIPF